MPKVLVMPVIGQQTDDPEAPTISEVYWLWCPACQDHVRITSDFGFNGNVDSPSFDLELHTVTHDNVCHATITDGEWHYMDDCTHKFAGKVLPVSDVPALEGVDSQHV